MHLLNISKTSVAETSRLKKQRGGGPTSMNIFYVRFYNATKSEYKYF